MNYLNTNSLFETVDNVSEALLFDLKIEEEERSAIANFIVNQQGKPYAYAASYAPTAFDTKHDLILFTGERITTNAGRFHMIAEEASRVLRSLNIADPKIHTSLKQTDDLLKGQINTYIEEGRYPFGMYCCKACSTAMWLNLSAGGLHNDTEMLRAGVEYLKNHRDGNGRWKGFHYYYSLYTLNEMDIEFSLKELKYTAPSVERLLKRKPAEDTRYQVRRNVILEQIIEKVNQN